MPAASRRPAPGPAPARRTRARTLERLMARVEHDPPPLAEPRLALLRRSRECLIRGEPPEPLEPAA